MKSFEDAIKFVSTWDGAFDGRDKDRFICYLPYNRVKDIGVSPIESLTEENWGEVRPWTEQEVLKTLKDDAEYGLDKAEGQRGLSSECMFFCVNMWCILLENGLEDLNYYGYGKHLFKKVLDHYNWSGTYKTTDIPYENGTIRVSQPTVKYAIEFKAGPEAIASISAEGIMRFSIDANDENAAKFVECIEKYVAGRQLTGIEVTKVNVTNQQENI